MFPFNLNYFLPLFFPGLLFLSRHSSTFSKEICLLNMTPSIPLLFIMKKPIVSSSPIVKFLSMFLIPMLLIGNHVSLDISYLSQLGLAFNLCLQCNFHYLFKCFIQYLKLNENSIGFKVSRIVWNS